MVLYIYDNFDRKMTIVQVHGQCFVHVKPKARSTRKKILY
jgi:hypothetical protein